MSAAELSELSDEKLSEVFAVEVAGYSEPITVYQWIDRKTKKRPITRYLNAPNSIKRYSSDYSCFILPDGSKNYCGNPNTLWEAPTNFATSADAVLPFLEKCRGWKAERFNESDIWLRVDAPIYADASAKTFARAACIALILAARAKKDNP